jgi:hypothetical protein
MKKLSLAAALLLFSASGFATEGKMDTTSRGKDDARDSYSQGASQAMSQTKGQDTKSSNTGGQKSTSSSSSSSMSHSRAGTGEHNR